jgi:hypothetical protein
MFADKGDVPRSHWLAATAGRSSLRGVFAGVIFSRLSLLKPFGALLASGRWVP